MYSSNKIKQNSKIIENEKNFHKCISPNSSNHYIKHCKRPQNDQINQNQTTLIL